MKTNETEQKYEIFNLKEWSYDHVYGRMWGYDEAKVLLVLGEYMNTEIAYGLSMEELMFIAETIYQEWRMAYCGEPASIREAWATTTYPWIKVRNSMEEGYVQEYARRAARSFIELYKKENEKL